MSPGPALYLCNSSGERVYQHTNTEGSIPCCQGSGGWSRDMQSGEPQGAPVVSQSCTTGEILAFCAVSSLSLRNEWNTARPRGMPTGCPGICECDLIWNKDLICGCS